MLNIDQTNQSVNKKIYIFKFKNNKDLFKYQRRFAYISITPIMILLIFFSLIPVLYVFIISFFDYTPVREGVGFLGLGGNNPFVGLKNYVNLINSNKTDAIIFRKSFLTTILFTIFYVPLNIFITLPLSILVEKVNVRIKGIFRAIYFMPAISSTVVVGLIWNVIYQPQEGLLNLFLNYIGLESKSWLTDPNAFFLGLPLPLISVMIALLWQEFGYNFVIFMAALQGIPQIFHDAARIDGANAWQEFWRITFPLLQPTFLLVCVLSIISTLQQFVIFQILTHGGPEYKTYTLVLNIYESAFRFQKMGWAAAISVILFILIGIVTALEFRFLKVKWEY